MLGVEVGFVVSERFDAGFVAEVEEGRDGGG